jgi:zinc/manganese transport system substrate-binding protein
MKSKKLFLFLFTLLLVPSVLWAKLTVVTTTEDLAAFARDVGGDLSQVDAICKGYMDPHFIDAKPSYLLKLKKADLFIENGLELEVGWVPPLLTGARNRKILPSGRGFLDASTGCDILQKTSGSVDRSKGDVHPFGNPHYWLDPNNGLVIAKNIAERLAELDAVHAEAYRNNFTVFESKLKAKDKEWLTAMAPFIGSRVVTYHNSWPNFAQHFGLEVVDFVEVRPGIPPTPLHIQQLTQRIKTEKIRLILVEPYFDTKLPERIAQQSGAKMLIFAPSVGAEPHIKTYIDLFDHNVQLLIRELGERK